MDDRQLEAACLLAHALAGGGKYEAARDILLGLAGASSDVPFVGRNLVHVYLRLGDYGTALPLAKELAEREADGEGKAAALFFLAHALWGCGETEECRRVVERYAEQLKEASGTHRP